MRKMLFAAVSAIVLAGAVAASAQGLPPNHHSASTDQAWWVNAR